jgi:eukaryotic-like serine/threonine-protein kinase
MTRLPADLLTTLHGLLDEALDLEPAQLGAWMNRLREAEPENAAELERLLAAEPALDAQRFLADGPVAGPLPTLEGRRVGAWTIDRQLGRGGMGTVWQAHRSDGRFEGIAAVKLLNLARLDAVGAERFRREGTLLGRLGHPNIARLLDAGLTDGGQPYLVLEHVAGERIDRYCDALRLSPEQRIRRVLDVVGAVSHAHANLVVHRDLKPSNILVTADGAVKLLDFGIAKLLEDGTGTESAALTDVGDGRALTPEYAAPEQVSGGVITTATDVYALGVLLYVLLTGRHPTGQGSRTAAEHFRGIVEVEPQRPSSVVEDAAATLRSASAARLRRIYAGDLDNIVLKALRKRADDRYATVGALGADLRRYLGHEPVSARPDSAGYRLRKFIRRNRLPVAAGSAIALGLLIGIVRERELRGRAEAEARKAVAVQDYLVSVFGAADPLAPPESRPEETTARALLDHGAARIDTALGGEAEVRATLRTALGQVYANLALYDKAASQFDRALAERRGVLRAKDPAIAEAMDRLGTVRAQQERLVEADSLLRGALARRRALFGDQHDATAESLDHLADVLQGRNDYDGAEPLRREALAIRRALHGDSALVVATSKLNLGRLLYDRGAYADAGAMYREVIAVRERRLGPDHPGTSEAVLALGSAEEFQGHFAAAERLYRRALESQRTTLGPNHQLVAATLNNLGKMLHKAGEARWPEAEVLLRESLAINRRVFGARHSTVSTNLGHLAILMREEGKLDEAEGMLREALAIDRALYGDEYDGVAFGLNELGAVLRMRGHPDSAVPLLREAVRQTRKIFGESHRSTMATTVHLARALREAGQYAEAEPLFRSAAERLDMENEDTRLLAIPARVGLGRTLVALHRPAEARPLLESTLEFTRKSLGAAHWRTAEAELGLGDCLREMGAYAEAEPLLRSSYAALQAQRAQPQLPGEAAAALGRLYRGRGRTDSSAERE